MSMFDLYTLPNHARVILVPQKDTASLTTLIMYPVGSRYEPAHLAGASHYIEHLMFKGTKKRKNTLTLTREIDRLGAEYNAFTGKEYTAYYIKADAKYTDVSLDILSDMLFNSVFDPKEMEREKGPVIEEIRMYKDNPMMNIENIFEEVMYAGSPLGRDISGTEQHIRNLERSDVLVYKEKYYDPSNMTVVLAGNMVENIREKVAAYFGAKAKDHGVSKSFKPYQFGGAGKQDRIKVEQKKTDQIQLMLGFPGFPTDADENSTLAVLNTILGGSMSSRLFIQVRERRGLAYMIRSGTEHYRDTGYNFVRAGLEKKNIGKAMKVILDEIEKLKSKAVTPRELVDAKTHIRGALTLTLEDSSSQANWYAREAVFRRQILTPEERLQKIETVTVADIQALAKRAFLMPQMRVAVIGDVSEKEINID